MAMRWSTRLTSRRFASATTMLALLAVASTAIPASSATSAQSAPTGTATPRVDYQATINNLQEQLADLETAIAQDGGASSTDVATATARAVATATPKSSEGVATSTVVLTDDYELYGEIGDGWTVTTGVLDDKISFEVVRTETASTISSSYKREPVGVWLVVVMDISVTDAAYSPFPFEDWVLQDGVGRVYDANLRASNSWSVEHGDMSLGFEDWWQETTFDDPTVHHTAGLVFDVPADADGFLFRSTDGVLTVELDR